MGNNQTEKAFEEKRLAQTISLGEEQLKQAKEAADKKKNQKLSKPKKMCVKIQNTALHHCIHQTVSRHLFN